MGKDNGGDTDDGDEPDIAGNDLVAAIAAATRLSRFNECSSRDHSSRIERRPHPVAMCIFSGFGYSNDSSHDWHV